MSRSVWQCVKCGKQRVWYNPTPPPQERCPHGDYHVWTRIGRALQWLRKTLF